MIKPTLYLLIIFSIFLLSSCVDTVLIKKAYITNPPIVCLFDSARSNSIKLSSNFSSVENQLSYAINHKWGLESDLLYTFRGRFGFDIGCVYYKKIGKKGYTEISSGYGYFNSNSHLRSKPLDFGSSTGTGGLYYDQDLSSIYHKLYIQPSIFTRFEKFDLGFTLRLSLPYITNYNCNYSVLPYSGGTDYPSIETGSADFKNRLGLLFEPMVTFRFNKKRLIKMYVQMGTCISNKKIQFKGTETDDYHDGADPYYFTYHKFTKEFPLCSNFFLNAGLEFHIGKRRK